MSIRRAVLLAAAAVIVQAQGTPTFDTMTAKGNVTAGQTNGGEYKLGDTAVGPQHFAGTTISLPTVSALRSFRPDAFTVTGAATTQGFAATGDGGGAIYDWNASATCSTNAANVVCLQTTSPGHTTTGRWILRMPGGAVDIRANGAKCDGTTDDAAAINNLITWLSAIGGGTVVIPASMAATGPSGCVVSSASLLVKQGVNLVGAVNPFSASQAYAQAYNSTILLDPTKTITQTNGSRISDLVIWRKGLTTQTPATVADAFAAIDAWAADSSVGITLNSQSSVERVKIIGFNTALKQTAGGGNYVRDVMADAINGIDRGGGNSPTFITNYQSNNWWTANMGPRYGVVTATPTAGTGYTTGDSVQPSGGTCSIRPVLTVTASGGVPSALAVANVGDCTVQPNGQTFTGGTGTGLKANINWRSAAYRSGTGYYDHDGVGGYLTNYLFESQQIGIRVNNSIVVLRDGIVEGYSPFMPWSHPTGILTENCSATYLLNATATANWVNVQANAASDPTQATCNIGGGNNNVIGMTVISEGFFGSAATGYNTNVSIGPKALVSMINVRMTGGNGSGLSNVVMAANSVLSATNLVWATNNAHNPWITADGTATVRSCGGISDGTAALSTIGYADTCQP